MKKPDTKSKSLETQLYTLKTLSDIGREITSTLDMEKILFTIYKKVNKLMDATVFGIGLYHPEKKHIEYKFAIAENKKYKPYTRDTKDKNQFPVWCIDHKKPVFINDVSKEYKKYLKKNKLFEKELEDGSVEKVAHSILYQPIIVKKKVIGIISVQSYKKNVYTPYHLDILQNIASYAGMAIENAQQFLTIEEKVNERTANIVRQQKEIEKSYKNTKLLADIGREIAASLSVKQIMQKTYKNVNKLMDAAHFGIAIYNKKDNRLNYICNIEKGKALPFYFVDIEKDNRPASWCFNHQKEVILNDYRKDYVKYNLDTPKALAGEFTYSLIYLPLSSKKKQLGVITVQSFDRNAYTEYHLDILKNLAIYVVNALENAHLYQVVELEVKSRTEEIIKQKEEIERSYKNTKLLSEIGREMTSSLDIEKVLFTAYKKINKLMDATIFGIGLYHPDKKSIEYRLAVAENKRYKPYTRNTTDKNQFPVWCVENKKSIFISDVTKEYKKYFKKNPIKQRELEDGTKEKVVLSLLYQPIIVKEKVIGIITVQSYKVNAYTPHHLAVLQSIASYAGMAIENAQQYTAIEEKINERTLDIVRKQKEIELSHQNTKLLSDIGREIAASLSVKEIVEKTYANVNKLMDANSFGIALYNSEEKRLNFIYYIESGKPLPFHYADIEKDNRPAVFCFKNQKQVFINDYQKEYKKYKLNKPKDAVAGEFTHSIIYLPLTNADKQIGVITIQSFERNAYTEYHLDILKNLAVYVVNAMENARLYHNMELEVQSRTSEIIKQKKEIERSYTNTKLLSEIGREITSSLSVEDITNNVYKNINSLMDASIFGVGIFNEKEKQLDFLGDIERGEKLPFSFEKLTEESRSSVWCFKNQKEIIINDFQKDFQKYFPKKQRPAPASGEITESLIYLPLSTATKQLGVITVQCFKQNAYSEYHLNILRNLAIYVSIAIENAQLYENLKKRAEEIVVQKEEIEKSYRNTKLLSDMGREITASLSVEEISGKVYKNVNSLMDASVFGIALINEKENQLDFPGVIEKGKKLPVGINLLTEENRPSVWCFKNQKILVINDFNTDFPNYFPGQIRLRPINGEALESVVYLPLSTGSKHLGVITVQSFKQNAYSEYHLDILKSLAIYVVIALENARLYGNMEAEVKLRTAEIEQQKEELEKLSIVASETDNAVIIAGPNGDIQWVNAGFTRLTGYSLQELKEKRGNNLMEISGNPEIKQIVKDCIEQRKFVMYELMNKTIDGRDIWFQTMLTPILGQDGNVRNLVAIDSDITKLKNIEMEMRSQNEIISKKNKHITDSINYAKRIQDAILPSAEAIKKILPDSFVLFKPKDIVSGDFYWVTEKKGKLFFAVVDCTGHGVPGAFVSIIGHNGLYRAVNEFGLIKPSEILDKLNELVEETFRQNNSMQINDGMDIALCSYDKESQILEFAGANNPLYHISNGLLSEIKGDKQPIGAFDKRKKFTNYIINLKENDQIYVFSDGYADQFGGTEGKKFKYNKFKDVLISLQTTPMVEQGTILNDTISSWMEGFEQLDDICVIGMKV